MWPNMQSVSAVDEKSAGETVPMVMEEDAAEPSE